jgi:hypothetical protein
MLDFNEFWPTVYRMRGKVHLWCYVKGKLLVYRYSSTALESILYWISVECVKNFMMYSSDGCGGGGGGCGGGGDN